MVKMRVITPKIAPPALLADSRTRRIRMMARLKFMGEGRSDHASQSIFCTFRKK